MRSKAAIKHLKTERRNRVLETVHLKKAHMADPCSLKAASADTWRRMDYYVFLINMLPFKKVTYLRESKTLERERPSSHSLVFSTTAGLSGRKPWPLTRLWDLMFLTCGWQGDSHVNHHGLFPGSELAGSPRRVGNSSTLTWNVIVASNMSIIRLKDCPKSCNY